MVNSIGGIRVANLNVENVSDVTVRPEGIASVPQRQMNAALQTNLFSSLRATDHFLAAPRISLSVCVVFSRRMARKTHAVTMVG
jgi:hypothetical protein